MPDNNSTLTDAIRVIESYIDNVKVGLPLEVFEMVSRLTPMVNVDLLIKDGCGRTLLAWRDDQYAGQGWHIPGGIIRFKEMAVERIQQVALSEIGRQVEFNETPLAMNQVICDHTTRGHFISFLYDCSINSEFIPSNDGLRPVDPGFLQWHEKCPDNLVEVHEMYRQFI